MSEKLTARFAIAGTDENLRKQLKELPSSLRDLVASRSLHLDILWGASFASGDRLYVRKILDYFAATADRSLDVAIVVAHASAWMSGSRRYPLKKLLSKYDHSESMEIIRAASALWSLKSNARKHSFVHEALSDFAKNANVRTRRDGSVVIHGSLASWAIGGYLRAERSERLRNEHLAAPPPTISAETATRASMTAELQTLTVRSSRTRNSPILILLGAAYEVSSACFADDLFAYFGAATRRCTPDVCGRPGECKHNVSFGEHVVRC
jgi:hypothetical protein